MINPGEEWHDFDINSEGFTMLDPIKATIITPGINVKGDFDEFGIPATLLSKYLVEHGIVVEKTGLYSFFIMFNIGITKGRWNSLVTELQQFKDDYDQNLPLWRILPEFVAKRPEYERVGLKDLCQQIHKMYQKYDVAKITNNMYVSNIEPAMIPADAWDRMAHNQIERVTIDELEGRVTAMMITPYPPGIPLMIPGEKFTPEIINYLHYIKNFNEQFPGFESDVHGLITKKVNGKKVYYVDVVCE
jgi:arginine decarboxylase